MLDKLSKNKSTVCHNEQSLQTTDDHPSAPLDVFEQYAAPTPDGSSQRKYQLLKFGRDSANSPYLYAVPGHDTLRENVGIQGDETPTVEIEMDGGQCSSDTRRSTSSGIYVDVVR